MVDTPVCGSSIPILKQTYASGKDGGGLAGQKSARMMTQKFLLGTQHHSKTHSRHHLSPKKGAHQHDFWSFVPIFAIIIRSWYTPFVSLIFFCACQSFWHYCQFEQIAQFLATDMLILLVINLIISHHITPWYPHEMIGFILPNIQLKVQVFIVKSAWFTVFHHVESTFF